MEPRTRSPWSLLIRAGLTMALLVSLAIGGLGLTAFGQEATPEAVEEPEPPRPAHVHTGRCNEVGEVVAPLADLSAPEGDAVGQRNRAITAETSFTNVPLTIDQMVADNHVINIHESADAIDVYIACGEIGGVFDATGALVIGLREQNNSGHAGIAFLSPGADGASTDISVFIAHDLTRRAGRGAAPEAEATPTS